MNKDSIIFSTTINYLITISLLIISFIFLLSYENFTKEEQISNRYKALTRVVFKQRSELNLDSLAVLKEMNYEVISKENAEEVLNSLDKKLLFVRGKPRDGFKVFEIKNKNYILFEQGRNILLVKDIESPNFSIFLYIFLVFILLFIAITFLYIKTLRKLLPLKELKENVSLLGSENFDFEIKNSEKKDEITLLANEFKNTALKLKNIKESRNIFIRNIMHELKTPITKGKFLINLENSEKNKDKMNLVFTRLEALINEFATIEELISGLQKIEKKPYFLEDLIDNAKDILMLEDENSIDLYENIKLNVNFKLFSIAIKNLLDNAIKYSTNEKVEIKNIGEDLYFINDGIALEGEFENYLEPFVKKGDTNSFGLGLYIVNTILKAISYKLLYKYEDGKNIFICKKD